MVATLRPVLLACLAAALAACASGSSAPSGASGEPLRVTLRDYAGGARFELLSAAPEERVRYYSAARRDASRKIAEAEVLEVLVEYLEREGLARHGRPGKLPSSGGGALTRGFEIEGPVGVVHWAVGVDTPAEERRRMVECSTGFLAVYNEVQGYQTIENERGAAFFQEEAGQSAGAPSEAD